MMDADLATFRFRNITVDGSTPILGNVRAIGGDGRVIFFDQHGSVGWRIWLNKLTEASGTSFFPPVEEVDADFLREKLFFETLPHEDLRDYQNQYIAIHGQRIADHDHDLYALTNRFFSTWGHVPVYITFVGAKPRHFIPGPILL